MVIRKSMNPVALIAVLIPCLTLSTESRESEPKPDVKTLSVDLGKNEWKQITFSYKLARNPKVTTPQVNEAHNDHSGLTAQGDQLVLSSGGALEMMLLSGTIQTERRDISLDVSGLGNCWSLDDPDPIPSHYALVKYMGEGVVSLKICFAKGGAQDFLVEWWIKDGASIRMKIEYLGDRLPEWTER